jgi:hypothetical protein
MEAANAARGCLNDYSYRVEGVLSDRSPVGSPDPLSLELGLARGLLSKVRCRGCRHSTEGVERCGADSHPTDALIGYT